MSGKEEVDSLTLGPMQPLANQADAGNKDSGHDAHQSDGQSTDGTLDGSELDSRGRPDAMRRSSKRQSFGNPAFDTQYTHDRRSDNAPDNTDRDNNDGRQLRNASILFGNAHGNGCRHGFGLERGNQRRVGAHQFADDNHACNSHNRPHKDRGENRHDIALQVLHLRIQHITQCHYRGTEHEMNQVASLLERFIRDLQQFQQGDNDENGGEQRMQEAQVRFLIEASGGDVGPDHQHQVE